MRPHTPAQNITQHWNASNHRGTDWGMPNGTNLVAVMDGTVVDYTRADGAEVNRPLRGHMTNSQNWHPGRGGIDDIGNCLVLKHSNTTYTAYLHVSPYNVSALRGRTFKKGDILPVKSGHNGWSTAPHLHFEVFINGTRRNPVPWLDNIKPPTSGGGNVSTFQNEQEVRPYYFAIRGNNATLAERKGWIGKQKESFITSPNTITEVTNRTNKMNRLESDLATRTQERNTARNQRDVARSRVDSLEEIVNKKSAAVEQLSRDKVKLIAEVEEVEDEIKARKKQAEYYEGIIGGLHGTIDELTKKLEIVQKGQQEAVEDAIERSALGYIVHGIRKAYRQAKKFLGNVK